MNASPGIIKYTLNTLWLFVSKFFNLGINLFVGIIVARYLGPEKLGILSYSQSLVLLLGPIVNLGLDTLVIRQLINEKDKQNVLLGTCFILKIIGVILSWVVLSCVLPFMGNDYYTNILIAIIAFGLIFQTFGTINLYFQSRVLSKYIASSMITANLIISALKLALVFFTANLLWFASAIVLHNIILAIFLILFYKKQKQYLLNWRFNTNVAKKLLNDSWPLILSGLMIVLYMKIDQVMLKFMTNASEVGIYTVAVRISEVWYFIPVLITQSIFPAIVSAKKTNNALLQNRMQTLYDLMTFLSLSISITLALSSSMIMNLFYGSAFAGSDKVLSIHIWAGIFVFWGTARAKWIIVENLQAKAFIVHVCGAVLNIALNLILIPRYNAIGAALATSLSYSLNSIITSIIIKEFRGQFILFLKSFLNIATFKFIKSIKSNIFGP